MTLAAEFAAARAELAEARAAYVKAYETLPDGSTHRYVALDALTERINEAARTLLKLEAEDRD
jgi:hypothetical protein